VKICPVCSTEYADDVKFCPNDGQTLRSAAPASDLVGQVVADRYHVIKKLGEGGMGQVYLAEHVKMGRRSAIKVMNPSMVHDPDAVARFNREASNASRITHPNVCAIYDFTGKLPFEATTVQETMIKRLTDEPTKLAVSRPDLTFPAGLQGVLDTALTRTPMERYQTVAKFADDVASVTGVGRGAASGVPQTRSGAADTEGKTQLLDTSAGLTQRISATRAPSPAAAAKKRSMVPMAVGVVVVLAVGGAWVVLSGGQKQNAVSPDTAALGPIPQNADSGRRGTGAPAGRNQQTPRLGSTGIDPAQAAEILDALIESTPAVIRDSATKVFNTAGVAGADKAFAACMIAQAEQALGNRVSALGWADTGLRRNANLTSCQNVVQMLRP